MNMNGSRLSVEPNRLDCRIIINKLIITLVTTVNRDNNIDNDNHNVDNIENVTNHLDSLKARNKDEQRCIKDAIAKTNTTPIRKQVA